jgi:hypothetical protein
LRADIGAMRECLELLMLRRLAFSNLGPETEKPAQGGLLNVFCDLDGGRDRD